ncbi:MAG: hypothetical protein UY49_C0015G0010 [Microgenomates group bacterium GW2011_GWC1_49_7]|nr:MAG: hypothetical protein UY49_C0015G0010 [Microgenomates group bacterium GW2011_GWC1_49_7]
MKKVILIVLALALTTQVAAQTATPSGDSKQKLDDLKERLATKVAELRQTQKRAIYGTVKATSVSTITVETKTSDAKIELTDEISVFQNLKGKRTELTTEDLVKGDTVVVFGDYDANLDLLKAQAIFIQGAIPTRISGVVMETNKNDFTLTVKTPDGPSYIIDFETTTKASLWTKDKGSAKGSFSKLLVGDTVHVLGTPVAKKENRLSAARILSLGAISGSAPTATPIPEEKASPSASPKATPKPTPTP